MCWQIPKVVLLDNPGLTRYSRISRYHGGSNVVHPARKFARLKSEKIALRKPRSEAHPGPIIAPRPSTRARW